MGGDDIGFAAAHGAGDAEEPDEVAVVAVEELACVGAVDADFVDLAGVFAEVFDVAEDVAAGVLRDKISIFQKKKPLVSYSYSPVEGEKMMIG